MFQFQSVIGVLILTGALFLPSSHVSRAEEAAAGPEPDGSGGGEFVVFPGLDEPTTEQRVEIWDAIHANIRRLESEGLLPFQPESHVQLQLPIAPWNGLKHYGYHGISNFVDQNAAYPNQLLDWNCGTRTYDTSSGYNHQGVDFFTWPFGWYMMDNSLIAAVAAAQGTIIYKSDGNYDRNCAFNSSNWNAVYVRHADNSIAWYGHLKNGSVTAKAVGQSVAQGEYLGIIGSSGNSTGPHLHFEVYDSAGPLNDPYQGTCNTKNPITWWAVQPPYYDSAVNHISTNFAAPVFPSCPTQETPNEQAIFPFGSTVYFTTYYRDQLSTQTSTYRIYRPDGSLYSQWTHNSPANYVGSYWYWYFTNFAPSGPAGTWRFEVAFQTRTYRHYFAVGSAPAAGDVTGQLTVSKIDASQVSLSWNASCLSGDLDYDVYEGALGQFVGHLPRTCSTAGALTYTFEPRSRPAGSGSYFLVAPANPFREGSLGKTSSGLQRPQGPSPCMTQLVASCP